MKTDFKLEDLPKHNIYQVPDNYFDRLPMRVMERTAGATKQVPSWQKSLWLPLRAAIAPLILLLVFVGVFFLNTDQPEKEQAYAVGPLSEQEILNYLDAHEDLETADFAELTSLTSQELAVEFSNISSTAAEEELEFYHTRDIEE